MNPLRKVLTMKKWIAFLLLLTVLLGLCACGGGSEEEATEPSDGSALDGKFCVGFGRENITPMEDAVPLRGYGGNTSQRMSTGFLDYLYATCVAITGENGNTILLIHSDLIGGLQIVSKNVLLEVSQVTGVPEENIAFAGTHTHHGPDMANTAEASILAFNSGLPALVAKAAKAAMDDRAPATMYTGDTQIPANTLNFIRHYKLNTGGYAGDNFGDFSGAKIVSHHHDADSQMQLIQFKREGADDIVMANWQAHPHRTGAFDDSSRFYNSLTSDIVGSMRSKMEKDTGCKFIYFTGAAGNINSHSNVESENVTKDPWEQGEALAGYAKEILENMTEAETGDVKVENQSYTGPADKSKVHLLEKAQKVNNFYIQSGQNLKQSIQYARSLGLNSWHEAMAIIRKATAADTCSINLQAMSVGSVGFISAPYEMFDENGLYVKTESPFETTFVISCSNDVVGYISSVAGFEVDCYGSNTGPFAKGCAEQIAEQYVSMLEQLHSGN